MEREREMRKIEKGGREGGRERERERERESLSKQHQLPITHNACLSASATTGWILLFNLLDSMSAQPPLLSRSLSYNNVHACVSGRLARKSHGLNPSSSKYRTKESLFEFLSLLFILFLLLSPSPSLPYPLLFLSSLQRKQTQDGQCSPNPHSFPWR